MKIGVYTLMYGVRYPETVRQYLRNRVCTLTLLIAKELGEEYAVVTNSSRSSEANYVKITNKKTKASYNISFRNHGYFSNANVDRSIMLCRYGSWRELKSQFMESMLPEIKRIVDEERPFERDFERELDRRIGELLMKGAGLL